MNLNQLTNLLTQLHIRNTKYNQHLEINKMETENLDPFLELDLISQATLDNAQDRKRELETSYLAANLRQVLQNMKRKVALNPMINYEEDRQDSELVRLDNMLIAEGVASVDARGNPIPNVGSLPGSLSGTASPNDNVIENQEYKTKLAEIKNIYQLELNKYHRDCDQFTSHVMKLLHEHNRVRPITPQEMERMVRIIQKKFNSIQIQLKNSTCQAVIILRSRFLDLRRKRRNFSKTSTDILNEYFYAHLANPYPSEEAKEQLARECGISVSQVSNWFGNKRIRYKKNIGKAQEEANMYAARQASGESRFEMAPASQSSSIMMSPQDVANIKDEYQNYDYSDASES